jgi:hypothetical protein
MAMVALAQDGGERMYETGAWSETVNGLRGRLLTTRGKDFVGTHIVDVYLELKNVSDVGNPMEIYFDQFGSLKSDVTDVGGKPLKQPPNAASIASPGPFWLSIPWDGALRFRVSLSGYGIYKNSGTDIGMNSGNWVISPGDRKQYFLQSDFTAAPTSDKRRAWTGTLHLPKVLIPH